LRNIDNFFGTASIKTLKGNLPEEVSYGEIKLVLAVIDKED
jgi:hypothetical protein